MPSRKEIQWSQLRVGALVTAAMAVLVVLIVLMSGSTGGLFTKKLKLRAYFENTAGLKVGAPVALQGVSVGNVKKIRIVPSRAPYTVEVSFEVGRAYADDIHDSSSAAIAQAGMLGDSFIDIALGNGSGPVLKDGSEIRASGAPSIQDVIRNAEDSIKHATALITKIETLTDTLNSKKGTVGMLLNDPEMARKFVTVATNLETITTSMSKGKGSLGKLLNDDSLYNRANSAVDKLDRITTDLNDGKGSAGKLLKDDSLYNNLNAAVANTNKIVSEINAGHGTFGKLAKDDAFAQRLDDTVAHLDSILKAIDSGEGTAGQLIHNRSLYDHSDQTMQETQQLVKSIREDPKKYLVIRLKMF